MLVNPEGGEGAMTVLMGKLKNQGVVLERDGVLHLDPLCSVPAPQVAYNCLWLLWAGNRKIQENLSEVQGNLQSKFEYESPGVKNWSLA